MKKFSQMAIPYIIWSMLMLVLPMLLIAFYSFTQQGNSIISFSVTLEHYVKFFTDADFLIILWRITYLIVKRGYRISWCCVLPFPCGLTCW